jgi:hypothetical protein
MTGESVSHQDQRENISSLTLMSKGEKRFLLNTEESRVRMAECRGELGLNASVSINAKGGDCWKI